ncbi:MAG: hypothetical protein IH877_09585, partial [Gemmatimonadetes bacterium]|nr:hypothetical protein [Gemmatimonadota bacterium]
NFTQDGTNSSQGFHARLFNEVRFVGTAAAAQLLSFTDPADGAFSHFANVRFDNDIGGVTLATDIYAHCDLISSAGSTAIIIGNGFTLTVGGLDVNDLKLDRVLLVYDGIADAHSSGSFFGFSNVEFANYVATDIQMTVEDAGATLTFSGITLSTTPTGAGRYIQARDSNGAGPFLTINISSTPSNCTETFETELNGAVVNWTNC